MIVVTGAAGRLGRLVVSRLVDRGYQVLATDRVPFDESPAEFIRIDLGDPRRVGQMLKGAEGVIHMGAIPGPTREEVALPTGVDATEGINQESLGSQRRRAV